MARKQTRAAASKIAPGDTVTIRMYCQGLGDCFLLSFPRKGGGAPCRVLIDCGVLQHTDKEAERLRAVAEDLKKETGGAIDLLIVTHEHWDHVAGFSHAQDIFKTMSFGQVWLSWAENPNDPDAKIVKAELGKKKKLVHAALRAAGMLGLKPGARGSAIEQELHVTERLMDFYGPAASAAPAAAAKNKGMSLGETMDWLRGQVAAKNFCAPGECRALPEADDVKIYVLGPPKSPQAIRKMDPTGDQGYRHLAGVSSFMGAVESMNGGDGKAPPGPFEKQYGIDESDARIDPFFREFYGFADDPLGDDDSAWRRIDGNWLSGASRLALQLDTGVNNTSLALAFELPGGRTLIFPGDAQIGNWLSWDDVAFKDEKGAALDVTAKNLLNRAAFYKVGHHGSHNATRKAGGLEEMNGGDLVAMIPTDEAFALQQSPPHGWKMPFFELYQALKKSTNFRIARADYAKDDMPKLLDDPKRADADPGWTKFVAALRFSPKPLLATLKDRPLWVEYDLPL